MYPNKLVSLHIREGLLEYAILIVPSLSSLDREQLAGWDGDYDLDLALDYNADLAEAKKRENLKILSCD